VKYDELVATVATRAEVSRRHADEIILATLTALGERLTPDETKDLLAQLPKRYKQRVNAVSNPTPMTADEFVARVCELEGARAPSSDEARVHARAVLTTLTEAVNAGEINDIVAQLGDDYSPLLGFEPDEQEVAQEDVAAAFEELERDVAETFDTLAERLDETVDAIEAEPQPAETTVGSLAATGRAVTAGGRDAQELADAGRAAASGVGSRVVAVAEGTVRVVAEGARTVAQTAVGITAGVVQTARDRALDVVVTAVDVLEDATDRLDDAAEALQERVRRKAGAGR
jgi:uncharacterized protein (DUF2267 family)